MQVPVSCNRDCGAGCPLSATVEDGIIIKINDSIHRGEWMRGCPRGWGAHRVIYHSGRLTKPVIKNPDTGIHEEASWEWALDYTAERLSSIREKYGPESVMRLGGSGTCRGALHNTSILPRRFLNCFGGFTEITSSYSAAAVTFITPFVFGTSNVSVDAGSLKDSRFILLLGANIADLRYGCELLNRLKHLRSQGIRIVVVDPRKTRTVTSLDAEWIKINPGTDSAFIAAIIYDLIENGGLDYDYIDKYCSGFEDYRKWLFTPPHKTPEWAAEICGTRTSDVKSIADCYRRYSPAALIPGLSIQRNLGGEDAARSAMVLQAVTGNTGIPGGSSGGNIWGPSDKVRCGTMSAAPVRETGDPPPKIRYVPVYTWPDVILDDPSEYPGSNRENPPVKAAYNCGGNYLVQGADSGKSARAFNELDFIVTHELFMTPTARASDVVFPVADFLERSDIVFPEGNFLLYSAKAVEPPPGVKTDYEIFSLLAGRLGFEKRFTESRNEQDWLEHFINNSELAGDREAFKSTGIWFGERNDRITLSDFIADPVNNPLNTPSGKIEISSSKLSELGASPFPVFMNHRPAGKFQLITPHERLRINSQAIGKKSEPEAPLYINPADAEKLSIMEGCRVRIVSESGRLETFVRITGDIIQGTASLDCSYSNVLTSTVPTMPSEGSRTHSTFVDIEPV